MAEIMPLHDAIAALVHDGDTVALEGFTHLIPFAAGHEIVRQGRRDLELVRMTPDLIYDQLIGMGCPRRLVFSWGGNPGVGSLHRLRDAVENGWPNPLAIEEHSHAAMANAYETGAAGLPCAIFRGYIGVDLPKVNPHAKRAIITVEEIVDDFGPRSFNAVILPSWTITAIAHVPGGAYPSYAQGYYKRDNAFYKAWDAISRDRDTFQAWIKTNVLEQGPDAFAVHVR